MLRYWSSERTLWLHDTFGAPEPLGAPTLSGMLGTDASRNSARASADVARIAIRLSR